ncbi:MAG: NAD(P)-dependent oxidoreductase, partial [Actinomycetales bacterium]|nr:NAD(P)-dependent oxidoreductase [Actinomycetales bacterium]
MIPVAVLGLGAMGLPMVTHLASGDDFEVRGFDITPERRELAGAAGARPTGSAREAAAGAAVVVVSVRDGAQLETVLFGADDDSGVAGVLDPGAVVVVTSTVGEAAVVAAAQRLAERGVHTVDAPVSGGPVRAGTGDLLVMVGAPEEAIAAAREVLDALASTLHVVGDRVGQGQQLKVVNQLLCGIHTAAAAEALALAHRLGLDLDRVIDVLGQGAAASFMLADRGPRMAQQLRGEEPPLRSRLDVIGKDMRIVADLTRTVRLATPTASGADQLYRLGEA